jgi:hypothetical protein
MKNLIIAIIVVSAFALTSCIKKNEINENKLVSIYFTKSIFSSQNSLGTAD